MRSMAITQRPPPLRRPRRRLLTESSPLSQGAIRGKAANGGVVAHVGARNFAQQSFGEGHAQHGHHTTTAAAPPASPPATRKSPSFCAQPQAESQNPFRKGYRATRLLKHGFCDAIRYAHSVQNDGLFCKRGGKEHSPCGSACAAGPSCCRRSIQRSASVRRARPASSVTRGHAKLRRA